MANWNEFITSPLKASRQMHVSGRDVERGAQIDERRRQREIEAQKQSPMYPSRENAAALDVRGPLRDAMFFNALLRGPEQSAAASPSRTEQVARAALSGAGSFGGWAEEPVNEPTPDMLARFVGQAISDPLNAVGLGALKYAGQLAKRALPTATALGTSAYAGDAEASPLSGLMKFLRSGVEPSYVVKPKGGNWINNSVEDALRGLKRPRRVEVTDEEWSPGTPLYRSEPTELDNWISGPLTKYVKRDLATPEDPVRRLAEEGVLHFEPQTVRERSPLMEKVVGRRESAGFPVQGLGDAPLARGWENTSDTFVRNLTARDLSAAERDLTFGGKKMPPETVVHEANPFASGAGISDLGFNHLIDELGNALNPNSGLPTHLQLTPEAVQKMGIEKAVRRVADINAWRAEQKVAANAEIANKAMAVREYPHTAEKPNPKGLRWVELKAGELPEGMVVKKDALGIDEVRDAADNYIAQVGTHKDPRYKALADQLKYEGDTMGHCVGGYCDDVVSGRSRIFSLRDAKGEPHVTVEVAPRYADPKFEAPQEMADQWSARAHAEAKARRIPDDADEYMEYVTNREQELADAWNAAQKEAPRITQIKGKQNRKPNDEYLPFVQDFVRNPPHGAPWGDVGDIQNTGLKFFDKNIDLGAGIKLPEGYYSADEVAKRLKESGVPEQNISGWLRGQGFASGGHVQNNSHPPIDLQGIMQQLMEHHAHA